MPGILIPSAVKDLRALAPWLVETYHAGNYYQMAKALQVSSGLPYQWRDGVVKRLSEDTMARMVDVYGLDPRQLMEVNHGLRRHPLLTARRLLAAATISAGLLTHPLQSLDDSRAPWTAPPLPVASRLAGRGILSSWRVQWGWWGAVADSYLALAWRLGLTSFRSWPCVSIEPYGA